MADFPGKLDEGLWFCAFKEAGSGALVMAITIRDLSTLRPGDSVIVSGKIRDVTLQSVSLQDAIVGGKNVPST